MEHPLPLRHLSRRRVSAPATTPLGTRESEAPIETLFFHPSVKVVSFSAPVTAVSLDPESARREAGTLLSHSRSERTIAFGSMRIYRAPGSVAFLSCGAALQPILPKSQCWCIDENGTTYVLQVRRPTFWRIELLVAAAQHKAIATELKAVLDQVLQFEKTYCPFQRTFSVELPGQSETPVKKKPWTPKTLPRVTDIAGAELRSGATDNHPSTSHTQPCHATEMSSERNLAEGRAADQCEPRSSVSDVEETFETQNLVAEVVTTSRKEHSTTTSSGREPDQYSEYDFEGSGALNTPLSATVASIVGTIHERFGRMTIPTSAGACQPGTLAPRDHANTQGPSPQPRRHSFNSFRFPPLQVSEDNAFLEPMSTFCHGSLEHRRPHSRSGSSPHASQSTNITDVLDEHSRKPYNLYSKCKDGDDLQFLATHNIAGCPLPSPATANPANLRVDREAADPEMLGTFAASFGASQCKSNMDDTAKFQTHSSDDSESLPRSQTPKLCAGPELRLKNIPGTHSASASPTRSNICQVSTSESRQTPMSRSLQNLPLNIVYKIYDALLLPMAYVIALFLKLVARVLLVRRSKPAFRKKKHGDRVPGFLQDSEDDLTE